VDEMGRGSERTARKCPTKYHEEAQGEQDIKVRRACI